MELNQTDDKQRFELTPKQLESMSYRVAVAAVNAERYDEKTPAFSHDGPVIHFILKCMAANADREGARRREYQVEVYAQTLGQAKAAFYAQTVMYEVEVQDVVGAELITSDKLRTLPQVAQGLRSNNGAFLIESAKNLRKMRLTVIFLLIHKTP